jgi:hypothetical protein
MKPFECEKESLVIEAVRSGSWDADLREHPAHCDSCSDAALAARVLNEMRAVDQAEARIPDAGLMWWKAQLVAKRTAAERATQPISFVERFTYACGIFCFIGVCVWQWDAIRAWFASIKSASGGLRSAMPTWHFDVRTVQSSIVSWVEKAGSLQKSSLMIVLSVGVLLIFVAFAAYFARSEE